MPKIPRRVDEHTLVERIRSLERRLAVLDARTALSATDSSDPGAVEEPSSNALDNPNDVS